MQKDKIITPMLKEIVSKGSGKLEGLDFRIKSEEALERKLKSKSKQKGTAVNEYANKVTDVLRYTNVSKEENLVADYDIIVKELHMK